MLLVTSLLGQMKKDVWTYPIANPSSMDASVLLMALSQRFFAQLGIYIQMLVVISMVLKDVLF